MTGNAITPQHHPSVRGLRGRLLGLGALIVLGASVTGANAQVVFGYGYARPYPGPVFYENDLPPVSPRSVVYRLQDRGFTEIARSRFDGTAWIVDATNPAGARVRLFVDARTGGVIGRQRLDAPYYPGNRVARAAPGYGWTEDEADARARNPERLVPPGNIPSPGPLPQAGVDGVPPPRTGGAPVRTATRPLPGASANATDANPSGINPDAKGEAKPRTTPQPRKSAKLTPPAKSAAPPASPDAPRPSTGEQVAPRANPAQEPAKAATQPEPSKAEQPAAQAPAAAPSPDRPADKAVAEKPAAKDWQDPPAAETKRNVRVIGGATVVPGGGPEAPAGTN